MPKKEGRIGPLKYLFELFTGLFSHFSGPGLPHEWFRGRSKSFRSWDGRGDVHRIKYDDMDEISIDGQVVIRLCLLGLKFSAFGTLIALAGASDVLLWPFLMQIFSGNHVSDGFALIFRLRKRLAGGSWTDLCQHKGAAEGCPGLHHDEPAPRA